jgi:hypothetical protein
MTYRGPASKPIVDSQMMPRHLRIAPCRRAGRRRDPRHPNRPAHCVTADAIPVNDPNVHFEAPPSRNSCTAFVSNNTGARDHRIRLATTSLLANAAIFSGACLALFRSACFTP